MLVDFAIYDEVVSDFSPLGDATDFDIDQGDFVSSVSDVGFFEIDQLAPNWLPTPNETSPTMAQGEPMNLHVWSPSPDDECQPSKKAKYADQLARLSREELIAKVEHYHSIVSQLQDLVMTRSIHSGMEL